MAIEQKTIRSIGELLESLGPICRRAKIVWFRGHSDSSWHLEPQLSRKGLLDSEMQLMKRFKQNAFQFLPHVPQDEWEWMFLMQHYGVYTRLLDWTESPLFGLYFALLEDCFKPKSRKPPAALWCLFPRKLNEASGLVLNPPDDIPAFGDDKELNDYLPTNIQGQSASTRGPLAIIVPRQFGRVYAQLGVATIFHKGAKRIEDLEDTHQRQEHLVKLNIPRNSVSRLKRELALLKVDRLTVFPQLENVAAHAIEGV